MTRQKYWHASRRRVNPRRPQEGRGLVRAHMKLDDIELSGRAETSIMGARESLPFCWMRRETQEMDTRPVGAWAAAEGERCMVSPI